MNILGQSKYTGKIGTHNMWEEMYIIIEIKIHAERSEAKNFDI